MNYKMLRKFIYINIGVAIAMELFSSTSRKPVESVITVARG